MRCILDLDGILVDFHSAWALHHNVTPDWEKGYELSIATNIIEANCWNNISDEWWANLPWTNDGKDILAVVEKLFATDQILIVTRAPYTIGSHHIGPSGKVKWIAKHIPDYLNRYMVGTHRHWLANPETILIDDSDSNVQSYSGPSILVPRLWNSQREWHKINVPDYLEWSLQNILAVQSIESQSNQT
jgi:5'(3')-deoxyribonucleotidase